MQIPYFAMEFKQLRRKSRLSISQAAELLGVTARTIRRYETGESRAPKVATTWLREKVCDTETKKNQTKNASFSFIDLFAGIGGLRRGFEIIGGKCIFTSEWDAHCQETYVANFTDDEHDILGDIRAVPIERIPAHDLLIAGFPCQPFSIAGVSKKNALNRPHGFACEAQGTLFFEVAKIIKAHRPKAFVLENVKNLVNHDKGKTFEVIHEILTKELRYKVDWKIIDAKPWLPQHRERIFIVGFRDQPDFSFQSMIVPDSLKGPKLELILHPQDGTEKVDKRYTFGTGGKVLDKYTLSEHLWSYLQSYAEKHRLKGNGFGFGLVGPEDVARTLSARYYKDGSEILIRQQGKQPRRLTPRECARLMGFEKPKEQKFRIPVSDTQAYKQFGNSVAIPVVEAVATYIKPYILEATEAPKIKRAAVG